MTSQPLLHFSIFYECTTLIRGQQITHQIIINWTEIGIWRQIWMIKCLALFLFDCCLFPFATFAFHWCDRKHQRALNHCCTCNNKCITLIRGRQYEMLFPSFCICLIVEFLEVTVRLTFVHIFLFTHRLNDDHYIHYSIISLSRIQLYIIVQKNTQNNTDTAAQFNVIWLCIRLVRRTYCVWVRFDRTVKMLKFNLYDID